MLKTLWPSFGRKTETDPFVLLTERYLRRIRKHHRQVVPPKSGARVGVVVAPWQTTAVPFYLIEWAFRLRREGLDVEFVWDVWPNAPDRTTPEERQILRALEAAKSAAGIPMVVPERSDLSGVCKSSRLAKLAFETITRQRGREPMPDDPEVAAEEMRLESHVVAVGKLLADRAYDWILLPGGVWAVSGVYWDACLSQNVRLTTFDSGPGLLCFQHGGPAAHFPDLALSMKLLARKCSEQPAVREQVVSWVRERLGVRRKGEDDFQLQPQGAEAPAQSYDLVVPLNYRLDTAAMCRQRLFSSVNEWLAALVDWVRQRPDISMVVRQHPCEKIPAYRSREDYAWMTGPNIRFVAAEDSVNTYDLLSRCRVVLPYSSRVGIEAAVMGHPVVLAAHAYYETMDFAEAPASRQEYFDRIEALLATPPSCSAQQQDSACAAYFVAEKFGLHKTHFTPIPSDFERWVEETPEQLWTSDPNPALLEAAVRRVSAAELMVQRIFPE